MITYGYTLFMTTGIDQYPGLILRTLFLAFVLAAGTWMMYGIIRERTRMETTGTCRASQRPEPESLQKTGNNLL